ncbi:MAG: PEP-CTERM sorting domain-containing protein, partial [Planctomycetota bacterium]|nr:PEP-CTERM sorting domain-containing protein [Planctomycetota bacterium]
NGDSKINIDDYYLMDVGYTYQGAPMGESSSLSTLAVPEPATMGLLLIGAAALLRRRRAGR